MLGKGFLKESMENFEQNEINLLKGKGFEIKTKLFGRKRIWTTKKMSLKRLIDLSDVYIKMQVDEDKLYSEKLADTISEQFISVKKNGKRMAQILAIATSSNFLMRWFLTYHFLRFINPSELREYVEKLLKQGDYQNFITSIVLTNGNRITKPQTIEKTKA